MIICVKNVSKEMTENAVSELFGKYGKVRSVATSLSKAYVEMPDKNDAIRAIERLDGSEHYGQVIRVKRSRPSLPNWLHYTPQFGLVRLI